MKGVGRYTAAAIASFAYKEKVPVVDGNVQRVLSRIFGVSDDISLPKTQKKFEQIAQKHISETHPDLFNQAIMEFGATYCMPHNPECKTCIFKTVCFANQQEMVEKLPVKVRKTKVRNRFLHYLVFRHGNELAMKQRKEKDIWTGLFDFYLIESEEEWQELELHKHMKISNGIETKPYKVSDTFLHLLSHQRLYVKFYHYLISEKQKIEGLGLKFYTLEETEKLPKPVLLANYLIEENFI
jgi:A/G-specific adenine glycosylase